MIAFYERERLANGNLKSNSSIIREIITCCGAGKCCPTWALILREVLGYKNVKLYDGSFEEWTRDPNLPVAR